MPHHWLGKRIEIPLSADTRRLRMDRISTFTTGLDCRLYSRPSSEGPSIFSISFKLSVPAIAVTFFKILESSVIETDISRKKCSFVSNSVTPGFTKV